MLKSCVRADIRKGIREMPLAVQQFSGRAVGQDSLRLDKRYDVLCAFPEMTETGSVVKEQSEYTLRFRCRCTAQSNFQTLGF